MKPTNLPSPRADCSLVEFFSSGRLGNGGHAWKSVERLARSRPRFVSVTLWGGRLDSRAHSQHCHACPTETSLVGAPHLTCIGRSRGEILDVARKVLGSGDQAPGRAAR